MKDVFIYSAKRTPMGSFMGTLSGVSAPKLGADAAKSAMADAKIEPKQIEEAIVGCVLAAGVGQAPARQVSIYSEIPESARALTVNKMCGSGLKAVALASEQIMLGRAEACLAGGTESMSKAPYLLPKAREGMRMGNQQVIDSMIHDGLWDVYNNFHMGNAAEMCAKEYKFTREEQDAFASASYLKSLKAIETGAFKNEIAAVEVKSRKDSVFIDTDEEPGRGKLDKFSKLRPAFDPKEGTITAANASSINDGAAMTVVGAEGVAGVKPLAKIIHYAEFAQEPEWFTTAPVGAMNKLLKETDLKVNDIHMFEVNEAFSVVAMAAARELGIKPERLNPKGGAVSLGHPIGASGARLLTTLIHTLEKGQKGVVSLCIGGGEANAMLIERL
jgi:acetyl-CoA C-acetyltransferase